LKTTLPIDAISKTLIFVKLEYTFLFHNCDNP
jgi:hypothetical protein